MKIRIIAVLLTLFSSFSYVSFVDNNPVEKEVCASGASPSCMRVNASCPPGYKNLIQSIEEGDLTLRGNNISQDRLIRSITETYNDYNDHLGYVDYQGTTPIRLDYQDLCINENLTDVITVFSGSENRDSDQFALPGSSNVFANDDFFSSELNVVAASDIPRVCPASTFASSPNYTGTGLPNPPWGCCPADYQYVTIGSYTSFTDLQENGNSACCYSGGNYAPAFWDSGNRTCLTENDVSIVIDYGDFEDIRIDMPDGYLYRGPIIFDDDDELNIRGDSMGPRSVITSIRDPSVISQGMPLANNFTCGNVSNRGCAITTHSGLPVLPAGLSNLNSKITAGAQNITSAGFFDDLNSNTNPSGSISCQGCLEYNEVIGFTEDNIYLCRDGEAFQTQLVNSSVEDTIACLRADGGATGNNYDLCKSCRESGGTWSGLGCIDSTPTGIVTWLIRIAYGVMGGVALIQFIIAGIYYQTGQEDKVREARKNIIATITGLAVLTFSILILRIIGINVLDILPIGSV